jgi:hypothetical protein
LKIYIYIYIYKKTPIIRKKKCNLSNTMLIWPKILAYYLYALRRGLVKP